MFNVPTNKIVLRRNVNLTKTPELSCTSLENNRAGGSSGLGAYKAKSIAQAANIIIGNVGKKYKRPIGRKSSRAEPSLPFKSVDLSLESGERHTTATTIKKKEGELSGSNSFRVDIDHNSKQKDAAYSPRFSEDMDVMQTEELPLQRQKKL